MEDGYIIHPHVAVRSSKNTSKVTKRRFGEQGKGIRAAENSVGGSNV